MATHTYGGCIEQAYRVSWRIRDVLGSVDFDLGRPWLPSALSGGPAIFCLNVDEKLKLTQVEMGAYAHLFGFLESFIAPFMVDLALDAEGENESAFEALTNFASEEIKHIHLFREVGRRVEGKLGFPMKLVTGQAEVARAVLSKSRGAVLLLTAATEWFTQHHYLAAMSHCDELDPLTREIFRCHWMEEVQHARLDHLEGLRLFRDMTDLERQEAMEDLVWLFARMDGLLEEQAVCDVANLSSHLCRTFSQAEQAEILAAVLQAKRRCFIECGVNHTNFQELFLSVATPPQRAKVQGAIALLMKKSPFH
jgi:hypothetical protein